MPRLIVSLKVVRLVEESVPIDRSRLQRRYTVSHGIVSDIFHTLQYVGYQLVPDVCACMRVIRVVCVAPPHVCIASWLSLAGARYCAWKSLCRNRWGPVGTPPSKVILYVVSHQFFWWPQGGPTQPFLSPQAIRLLVSLNVAYLILLANRTDRPHHFATEVLLWAIL